MNDAVILYTTWPDAETAQAFARSAVEAKLAACANVLAPMTSIYRWQGAVEQASETPMLLKTTAAAADRLRDLILARHPYETPCVVALAVREGGSNPALLQWIGEQIAWPAN
jgi:periplasmic divalent cation tolerance protein